jgi:hypothetical protein
MIWARHLKFLSKAGMASIVLCTLGAAAHARDSLQAKFTLAVETHWGNATLPPGDYTLTLQSNAAPYTLYIQGQTVSAIIQATTSTEKVVSERSQLDLMNISDVPTVQAFEAPQLGMTFIYWTPRQKHSGRKESRQQTVPPSVPPAQNSENSFSIPVHTAGR